MDALEAGQGEVQKLGSWMRLVFAPQAGEDCIHWQSADRALVKRINRLIDDAL